MPAGLADASLAHLPSEAGLYACLVSGLVFWLFCSSRHTAITVTSAISVLVGASLGDLAGGDISRFWALASCTALIVGGLGFIAWLAKAGVIVLTEVLATEWAQHNLRLNCVSPGVTRTANMQVAISQGLANEAKYARRAPIGRVGEVQDIANAVLFLASDRASYVTGENLVVDGGWVPWGNLRAVGFPE